MFPSPKDGGIAVQIDCIGVKTSFQKMVDDGNIVRLTGLEKVFVRT
jgi:hypothetical protein